VRSAAPPEVNVDTQFILKRWNELLADPELLRRPERIEIDAFGHFLMSPQPDSFHRKQALRIATLLEQLLPDDGTYPEQSILTTQGIRVADVIWINPSRAQELLKSPTQPLSPAPDICAEILSPSNTTEEIAQNRALYFGAGAHEVWICNRSNQISFFGPHGPLKQSSLCPDFPPEIRLTRS
jgi:Uma2 family endonuclease